MNLDVKMSTFLKYQNSVHVNKNIELILNQIELCIKTHLNIS